MEWNNNPSACPYFVFARPILQAKPRGAQNRNELLIREESGTTATPPWRDGSREDKEGCAEGLLFSHRFEEDGTGDHEESGDDSRNACRFPLNEPKEEADDQEEFQAV